MNKFKKLLVALIAIAIILLAGYGIFSLVQNGKIKKQATQCAQDYLKQNYNLDVDLKYISKEHKEMTSTADGITYDNVFYTYFYKVPSEDALTLKIEVKYDYNSKTTMVSKVEDYSVYEKKVELKDKVAQTVGQDYTILLSKDLNTITAMTEKEFKDCIGENYLKMCDDLKALVENTTIVISLEYAESSINGVDSEVLISYSADKVEEALVTFNIENALNSNKLFEELKSAVSVYANTTVSNYTNIHIADSFTEEKYTSVVNTAKELAAKHNFPISISADDAYVYVNPNGETSITYATK